ncbi:DUF1360 domain-containing protein [Paenibacillus sp. J5C_2022]|uniref:DUF1360 domain-containing protein n=1 Tax=Paenibacillus sp. J5C2022 TaxID=2977129 RepID=UPI0021CFDC6C|nr:DUF1360 domain-containing protein [Paenibacillus sp. J5C2022]MCU6710700.1 DUF1360 domain-containing protein [Paenibacillus sp. J5C2022]
MEHLTWLQLAVLVLAAYRLTRLLVFDEITAFLRRPFLEESFQQDEEGRLVAVVEEKGGRIRSFFRYLLTCYWCMGIWCATIVVVLYLLFPSYMYPPLLILAVAGAAGVLESFVKG